MSVSWNFRPFLLDPSKEDAPGRHLIAIDPDTNHTGWAIFSLGTLAKCGLIEVDKLRPWYDRLRQQAIIWDQQFMNGAPFDGAHCDSVVVETPVIYPYGRTTKRPSDIIKLAAVAGVFLAAGERDARAVAPKTWTRSAPKRVHQPRTMRALKPFEQETFDQCVQKYAKGKHSHVIDAVGIGLFALGRI